MGMIDYFVKDEKPPSRGSYTEVGIYEHTEMVNRVSVFST